VPKISGIKKFSVADAFTTLGAICGFTAIYFLLTMHGDIRVGTSFIILALVMDGCDGAAARKFGTKHDYGRHMDSIADAISFCLAPSVLVYTVFYKGNLLSVQGALAAVVMVLIVALGWTRLFKFSVEGYKLKNFSGLPTPANAFLVVILAHMLGGSLHDLWYIALPILLCAAILMVAPVPYPKVRGKVAVVLAMAIGLSFLVMIIPAFISTSDQTFATYNVITFLGFATIFAYLLGGPIYEKGSKKRSSGA
jgi:CDP-diacylglycerol--serine O-phosphatidyltransferase